MLICFNFGKLEREYKWLTDIELIKYCHFMNIRE